MFKDRTKILIFFLAITFSCLFVAPGVRAVSMGDLVNFNVNSNFESSGDFRVSASFIKSTASFNFFIEKKWWDSQIPSRQNEILNKLDILSLEFSNKIYPTLTSLFGTESKPGIDNDNKIAILFHPMREGAAGYFKSSDGYSKLQVPDSNEREMLYLSTSYINDSQLKVLLAHEFMHLVTFNQKDKLRGVSEEVWLNEVRADFASSIMGYDSIYDGSNLQKRVRDFLNSPSDSLTEWQERKSDYAVANLFTQYLVDHYGINILTDSLKSKLTGIESINEALLKSGAKENFSQIFTNWTIAIVINDCSINQRYCYLNSNLNSLKLNPSLIFLPLSGNSSLSSTNFTKNWSGNWQKIIGGSGDLHLDFSSSSSQNFQLPYIVYDKNNNYIVKYLKLDKKGRGSIDIKDFGNSSSSLIIIPSLQSKISGFDGAELSYPYTFNITINGSAPKEDPILIQNLLAQIESLKKQIAALQGGSSLPPVVSGACINSNLYFGVSNYAEVSCLQAFLKAQGLGIYPEALVTGAFGNLTKLAVIRFQEKYQIPNTGFVGPLTRAKINQLYGR